MTYEERMTELAERFHTLVDKPGIRPWSPKTLDQYACDQHTSEASQHAIAFLLEIWNCRYHWEVGKFQLRRAFEKWDPRMLEAFKSFAADPFLP